MSSPTSSPTPRERIKKAAISRWKLETLTGLLGFRSLQHHQSETEKNIAAENRHVRKSVWGETAEQSAAGDDMAGNTILGDNVHHPTPIVISQGSDIGLGKVLAGAALAATLIGIPGAGVAGYFASKLLTTAPITAPKPTTDESLDIGLGRFSDLKSEISNLK